MSSQYLLLINDNSYPDTTGAGYFYFPYTNNLNCDFLQKREKKIVIGPNYSTEYERYWKIPYVDNDTLIINKRKILWIKKDKANKVVGYYIFK